MRSTLAGEYATVTVNQEVGRQAQEPAFRDECPGRDPPTLG
jgi:hypothetical protein